MSLDSALGDLTQAIVEDRRSGKINKQKRRASSRVLGMLGYLKSQNQSGLVPRKISTIGEIYSFSHEEILKKFRFYKQKTWCELDKILQDYGLPPLNLPKEYGPDLKDR